VDADAEGPDEAVRLTELRAAAILRRQRMPAGEIRAVLAAGDPAIVRRYLELHRERLEEWLVGQRRVLEAVEGWLMADPVASTTGGHRRRSRGDVLSSHRTGPCRHP
jgi:hypothetical protein